MEQWKMSILTGVALIILGIIFAIIRNPQINRQNQRKDRSGPAGWHRSCVPCGSGHQWPF